MGHGKIVQRDQGFMGNSMTKNNKTIRKEIGVWGHCDLLK